jgi:hypothetical protein
MKARLVFLTLTLYMDMVGFYSGVGVDKIFVQVWDSDMGRFDLSFGVLLWIRFILSLTLCLRTSCFDPGSGVVMVSLGLAFRCRQFALEFGVWM